jgi:His/Glu/Gln/Arg/opine family amino acid ABC transporter permease subunit
MNLDFSTLAGAQDFLWQGFKYSLTLTVSSMVFGIFFGTLLAMARMSSIKPLSLAAAGYVDLFRSVPLVLVIFYSLSLWLFQRACAVSRSSCTHRPQETQQAKSTPTLS